MKINISFIVPSYNEEKNLEDAVVSLIKGVKDIVKSYEVIIIDDGSTDATGKVADRLSKEHKFVKVIHHKKNQGFGETIKDGIKFSTKDYVIGFPGDNDTSAISMRNLILRADEADVIISYTSNPGKRSGTRRFFSWFFIYIMNLILGLKLKYYNGSFLCKSKDLLKLNLVSKGFTIYAEAKIYLIKNGLSYIEVPFEHIGRKYGKTKTANISTVFQTIEFILHILKIYFIK
jgi:glycosyltransferase involved in cell wall biosynthesis